MPVDVVVVGAGGHAREIADIVRATGNFRVLGFLADSLPGPTDPIGSTYLGTIDQLERFSPHFVLAIGDSQVRAHVSARLDALGGRPISAVHPDSSIGRNVELGEGTILFPGARLTTDVQLGRHCHVNVNASVSHDSRLADFVTISPGSVVCGAVVVGARSYVGANACIIQNLTIGNDVMIGAGAVVTHHLPGPGVYVGCPARLLRSA